MNEKRKEEIILATLKLASEKGLGAVSMNMIASEIGIKKPSLYNHFKSKEALISETYLFLRNNAQKQTNTQMDFAIFENKSAYPILSFLVKNYISIVNEKNMQTFYKVIYSDRSVSKESAKILVTESDKMINATKQIFTVLKEKKLLEFENVEISAMSFALNIRSFIDYSLDKSFSLNDKPTIDIDLINSFIENFCNEHKIKD